MRESSWRYGVTRYQWLVLFVAWLGWVFDSMDATIYALVLHPALHDLLRVQTSGEVSQEAIGWYGGIILSIFLIGWAIGGVVFGVLADRFGRTKTLVLTILIYAVFTGLAALSSNWWQLAFYRFLTALGIGGEWAAGGGVGRGGLAGRETCQSGGSAAIRLGRRFSDSCCGQSADARARLALHFRGGHRACRGRAVHAAVGQRAGAVGQGA